MKVYEIICSGFDGSSDTTDHKVLWVNFLGSESELKAVCDKNHAILDSFINPVCIGLDLVTNSLNEIEQLIQERTNS